MNISDMIDKTYIVNMHGKHLVTVAFDTKGCVVTPQGGRSYETPHIHGQTIVDGNMAAVTESPELKITVDVK